MLRPVSLHLCRNIGYLRKSYLDGHQIPSEMSAALALGQSKSCQRWAQYGLALSWRD
jgi:hypothetical protein